MGIRLRGARTQGVERKSRGTRRDSIGVAERREDGAQVGLLGPLAAAPPGLPSNLSDAFFRPLKRFQGWPMRWGTMRPVLSVDSAASSWYSASVLTFQGSNRPR